MVVLDGVVVVIKRELVFRMRSALGATAAQESSRHRQANATPEWLPFPR